MLKIIGCFKSQSTINGNGVNEARLALAALLYFFFFSASADARIAATLLLTCHYYYYNNYNNNYDPSLVCMYIVFLVAIVLIVRLYMEFNFIIIIIYITLMRQNARALLGRTMQKLPQFRQSPFLAIIITYYYYYI